MEKIYARRLERLLGVDVEDATYDQVAALVAKHVAEGPDLEFKSSLPLGQSGWSGLLATVAGMANAVGGHILIGVDEQAGVVSSVPGVEVSAADLSRIPQTIQAFVSPPPEVDLYTKEDPTNPGRGVILVSVPPSSWNPHAVSLKGVVRFPVRLGGETRFLSEPEVADAYRRRNLFGLEYLSGSVEDVPIPRAASLTLSALGDRPDNCMEIVPAWWRLVSTHESVSGIFDVVRTLRQAGEDGASRNSSESRTTADVQDLLRAAIVFTSAGLDASVVSLVRHCVPILAEGHEAARSKFERFIENEATSSRITDAFRLALVDRSPRTKFMELYVGGLTVASFQGSSDMRNRASSALGITNQQIPKARFSSLDTFFSARNDVAHRLDLVEPERFDARPSRRPRGDDDVREMCDEALVLVADMISATAANLNECSEEFRL